MTLELKDICLRYSKKTVLDNLSLYFEDGQIHALLGENGAGKSTTANIICGELQPDSGQILIDGQSVSFTTPRQAIENGICYVHQTPMLADSISVKENLLLGIKKEYRANIKAVTQKWIGDISPDTFVYDLSGGMRFFVALCSALIKCPRLLILDEPTALLNDNQSAFLFENLRSLANDGMNIILITHNMDEAERYCDTVDFLEEGRLAPKKPLPVLNANMQGSPAAQNTDSDDIVFSNICASPVNSTPLYNLNFSVQKGKITLIQGLAQDGLTTLEKELMNRCLAGQINSFGRSQCAFIPTDRKNTASNPNLTVQQMLTSALNIPQNQKNQAALKMIEKAGVNITPEEKCRNLSGGMLQKLLFERELYNNPPLLILCNPLQGLDTQTCSKTISRIKQAANNGAYVLILSFGAFPGEFSDNSYKLMNGKIFGGRS